MLSSSILPNFEWLPLSSSDLSNPKRQISKRFTRWSKKRTKKTFSTTKLPRRSSFTVTPWDESNSVGKCSRARGENESRRWFESAPRCSSRDSHPVQWTFCLLLDRLTDWAPTTEGAGQRRRNARLNNGGWKYLHHLTATSYSHGTENYLPLRFALSRRRWITMRISSAFPLRPSTFQLSKWTRTSTFKRFNSNKMLMSLAICFSQ